ncbi:MAG: Spy/CpxP family protein refolding chaperone [Hyphomicrobiales bacterium]|nr:Spy/CpxP family protein refolding chaperone [Hyphomicrobiales bacterium]
MIERRERQAEQRRQLIEKRSEQAERRKAIGKARDKQIADRKRPKRDLVRRGTGERRLVLRNRALAERAARTPAARAMAKATFGGRFARHHDRDRHWRRWHRRHVHVIGWIGPLFWPYAYHDFIEYTFWPYAYDAFWPYAYDDVYESFFGPYAVGGPVYSSAIAGGGVGARTTGSRGGSGRPASRPSADAAQICTGETAGLTDWPIEQIAEAVNPNEAQRAALDRLGQETARAVKLLRSACPEELPSTPTGRMAAMRHRLEVMREAVQIVRPALEAFYASLTDEQKAQFNALEPSLPAAQLRARKAELSRVCSTAIVKTDGAPTERIEQSLRLSAEQRTALLQLDDATARSAQILADNCPTGDTLTPPGRLAAMEQRLDTMLKALEVVQPALSRFYESLSDEQKARFNQLGARRQAGR